MYLIIPCDNTETSLSQFATQKLLIFTKWKREHTAFESYFESYSLTYSMKLLENKTFFALLFKQVNLLRSQLRFINLAVGSATRFAKCTIYYFLRILWVHFVVNKRSSQSAVLFTSRTNYGYYARRFAWFQPVQKWQKGVHKVGRLFKIPVPTGNTAR